MDGDVTGMVMLADPKAENARLRDELVAAVASVIDSGSYILGREVACFETELAAELQVACAVGVGSGTDALVVSLLALGIRPGDEVILPSHTAGPTCAAVALVGATPVLIDVDPETFVVDANLVAAAITPRTRAVIAVHLYGFPADVEAIIEVTRGAGIAVIEDCAQAQGAMIGDRQVGGFGDISAFSFYPTKNLGAIGDGGAVVSRDGERMPTIKALRTYGWKISQFAELEGGRCSRLDEVQAAILRVKLSRLGANTAKRRALAERYRARLTGLGLQLPPESDDRTHAYHLFVVRTPRRDALAAFLRDRGVMTGRHYPYAVHQQPAFSAIARVPHELRATDALIPEILSLPLFPDMTDHQVDRVSEAVGKFFR